MATLKTAPISLESSTESISVDFGYGDHGLRSGNSLRHRGISSYLHQFPRPTALDDSEPATQTLDFPSVSDLNPTQTAATANLVNNFQNVQILPPGNSIINQITVAQGKM